MGGNARNTIFAPSYSGETELSAETVAQKHPRIEAIVHVFVSLPRFLSKRDFR
jgi:hypothetical protein